MARLLAYIANQADRLRCALAREAAGLEGASAPGAGRVEQGYGAGSYQHGEVLLRRRPSEARGVSFAEVLRELRTDCAIAHVRDRRVGSRSADDTPPFRFRDWLFAATGAPLDAERMRAVRAALLETVPSFLTKGVAGTSLDEVLFAQFLARLHRAGQLDDPELDGATLARALRGAYDEAQALASAQGLGALAMNLALTNRRALVVLRRGGPVSWLRRSGVRDCAACRRAPDSSSPTGRTVDHEHLRYLFVLSEAPCPSGWYELAPGAALVSDLALDVRALDP